MFDSDWLVVGTTDLRSLPELVLVLVANGRGMIPLASSSLYLNSYKYFKLAINDILNYALLTFSKSTNGAQSSSYIRYGTTLYHSIPCTTSEQANFNLDSALK